MRLPPFLALAVRAALLATSLAAAASAQKLPPVHFIDRPIVSTRHEFRSLANVRHLPNGSVLVNDVSRRQLLLLDSAFTAVTVVADSSPGSANSYGASPAGLLPYPGDSTLLLLPRVPSMYMIDPAGRVVRVMAVPRPQDAPSMATTLYGVPGLDAKGRFVYRGSTPPLSRPNLVPGGPPGIVLGVDSAPIVRVDPATRVFDTVAMIKINRLKGKSYPREGGMTYTMLESNPLPTVDDWAVLADGTIAIVRWQDYHVDFITADGTKTRGPKMAYAWEPLSDDAKVAIVDSIRKAFDERSNTPPQTLAGGPPGASASSGGGRSGGGTSVGGAVPPPGDRPPGEFISPSELPDYRPPFTQGAVRPDADGNLWIRTTHREAAAGSVYDVVSREGKVIDRVQLQPGRTILGFGKGGIVYISARDDSGSWIEKSKWRAP